MLWALELWAVLHSVCGNCLEDGRKPSLASYMTNLSYHGNAREVASALKAFKFLILPINFCSFLDFEIPISNRLYWTQSSLSQTRSNPRPNSIFKSDPVWLQPVTTTKYCRTLHWGKNNWIDRAQQMGMWTDSKQMGNCSCHWQVQYGIWGSGDKTKGWGFQSNGTLTGKSFKSGAWCKDSRAQNQENWLMTLRNSEKESEFKRLTGCHTCVSHCLQMPSEWMPVAAPNLLDKISTE